MLGQRIAVMRRQTGMSQAQLAKKLGISPSAVGMYEQGRREPPLDILVALSGILGVTTDYLLTGKPATSQEEKLVSRNLIQSIAAAQEQLRSRSEPPFSREELAALFAAMLLEP